MRTGEVLPFTVPVGSILTVTVTTGEAFINPISSSGAVGETIRVWSGNPSESLGPFATTRIYRVSCLIDECSVALTLFDPQSTIGAGDAVSMGVDQSFIKDEFIGGSLTLFAGEIGELGWFGNQVGSGSVVIPTLTSGDVDHPGIKRLSTGATLNSSAFIQLPSTTPLNLFMSEMSWDLQFIVNLRTAGSNARAAIGVGTTATPAALTGIRVEKAFADSDWFAFTGNGSTTTRSTLGAVVAGDWERFRIRRVDGTTIGFTRNGGTEVTIATTIPAAGTGLCVSMYVENNATSDKQLDVDYFDCLVSNLTR